MSESASWSGGATASVMRPVTEVLKRKLHERLLADTVKRSRTLLQLQQLPSTTTSASRCREQIDSASQRNTSLNYHRSTNPQPSTHPNINHNINANVNPNPSHSSRHSGNNDSHSDRCKLKKRRKKSASDETASSDQQRRQQRRRHCQLHGKTAFLIS